MKETRGGTRKGAGRKKKGKDKRVTLVARVKPETKKRANTNRGKLSLGKYLDSVIP